MAVNDKASLNPLQLTGKDTLEFILSLCAREATFDDLMQVMISSSPAILKKYLFYLIDYDFISCLWTKASLSYKRQRLRVRLYDGK
jgi:hypothetical protein